MAYYSSNSGQILVPSPQYLSHGAHHAPPTNTYPHSCPPSSDRLVPLPGRYSVTFSKTSAICLGSFLLCSGAVALVGSAFALRYYAALSEIGAGIWCGAMFIAAGSVAIAAGHHLTDCLISATTATSAFAVGFSVALITISSIGLAEDVDGYSCYPWCHDNYCPCYYDNWETLAIVGNSLMIGAGAFAFVFSLWLFVICCVALCQTPRSRVVPVYVQSAPQPITTTVIPNQQQVMSVPVQYVQLSAAPNQPLNHHQHERSENHHAGDHD